MPIWQLGRCALACLAIFMLAGTAQAATTLVTLVSPTGEVVGGGTGTRTFTEENSSIDVHLQGNRLILLVQQDSEWFNIELRSPKGTLLFPGNYLNAESLNHVTGMAPGMRVDSNLAFCDDAWGSFKVRDYLVNQISPESTRVEIIFTYRCNSATAPVLSGTIYYQAGPRSFSYSRDAGFPMGTATSRTYLGDTSELRLNGNKQSVSLMAAGLRDDWTFYFTAPDGKTLAKGVYPLAQESDATHAAVGAYLVDGGVCDNPSGTLNIRNVSYDATDKMTGLYATWNLYCDGQPAAFRGTFRSDL